MMVVGGGGDGMELNTRVMRFAYIRFLTFNLDYPFLGTFRCMWPEHGRAEDLRLLHLSQINV